ncbi:MAG: polysaccharide biosynthesis tyrosine autokinase [Burkholderiaceae bacterium]|nr:polysaccharide biosynthesis tyrosine autokinase [Burkholderiaceae bacterium]
MNTPEIVHYASVSGRSVDEGSKRTPGVRVASAHSPTLRDRPIGAILLDAGLIELADVERIVARQRENKLRFGDAAVSLGLVNTADLRAALAYQFDYPVLAPGSSRISREVLAAYDSAHPVLDDIRSLRNQLLLRWLTAEGQCNRVIAIASPDSGDGRSFVAANLAVTFSQMGQRTLLVDADLRRPRMHQLFGLDDRAGLSAMLADRNVRDAQHRIEGLHDLTVIPVGGLPPNPQDLLSRDSFAELLATLSTGYDAIVVDTPAASSSPEASVIATRARGCVVVARQGYTRLDALATLGQDLEELGVSIIGSIYCRH